MRIRVLPDGGFEYSYDELGPAFDFTSMLGDESYYTASGLPVTIDRVLRDVTKTTVLGVSGTMIVNGDKVRCAWDCYGNIIEFKKVQQITHLGCTFFETDGASYDTSKSMFRLVSVESLKKGGER